MPRARMGPDDPRHGTANGYVNLGCRCVPCKDAATANHRWQRYGIEPLPIDDPRHGTVAGFRQGCRCSRCRPARPSRPTWQRTRPLPAADPRHGSRIGYIHHGCRCERCETAFRETPGVVHNTDGYSDRCRCLPCTTVRQTRRQKSADARAEARAARRTADRARLQAEIERELASQAQLERARLIRQGLVTTDAVRDLLAADDAERTRRRDQRRVAQEQREMAHGARTKVADGGIAGGADAGSRRPSRGVGFDVREQRRQLARRIARGDIPPERVRDVVDRFYAGETPAM